MLTFPMPTCPEVRRELEALALGQLAMRELTLVHLHLADCRQCRGVARDVGHLVRDIRHLIRPRRRHAMRSFVRPAMVFAAIAVFIGIEMTAPDPHRPDTPGLPASQTMVTRLLAAQNEDGAWRERREDGDSATTLGLSGLATIACLEAASPDSASLSAARRASSYLAGAIQNDGLAISSDPVDVRIRAHAATAWALSTAAARWPEYRPAANRAQRALTTLEESGHGSDMITDLLVRAAFLVRRAPRSDPRNDVPGELAARLAAAPSTQDGSTVSVTHIVSEILCASIRD